MRVKVKSPAVSPSLVPGIHFTVAEDCPKLTCLTTDEPITRVSISACVLLKGACSLETWTEGSWCWEWRWSPEDCCKALNLPGCHPATLSWLLGNLWGWGATATGSLQHYFSIWTFRSSKANPASYWTTWRGGFSSPADWASPEVQSWLYTLYTIPCLSNWGRGKAERLAVAALMADWMTTRLSIRSFPKLFRSPRPSLSCWFPVLYLCCFPL